jgi:hypothetical protein
VRDHRRRRNRAETFAGAAESDEEIRQLGEEFAREKKGDRGGGRGGFIGEGWHGEGARVRQGARDRAARSNAVQRQGSCPSLMTT